MGAHPVTITYYGQVVIDNYMVMTSMNMAMQQTVCKSTIVLINSIFQIGMWAVDQKLKINFVWPYKTNTQHSTCKLKQHTVLLLLITFNSGQ